MQAEPDQERQWVVDYRQGDADAFRRLVELHHAAIYRIALRFLKDPADADETAQLAFVRAWQARSSFRGDAAFKTWVTRIVINVAKNQVAARKADLPLCEAVEQVDPTDCVETEMGREQLRARVRAVVDRLPPRQKTVVLLKIFSEMTHKQVAEAMELSEGAVKAHLHQAILNLRRRSAELEERGVS